MPTVRATNPNLLPKKLPTYPKVQPSKPLKGKPTLVGGFEWTPSSVAKWTGGNLASGVVGAVGGMLFGKALDAIGLGEPDLAKMLTDISNRLIGIENDVRATKQLTEQILQELRELRVTMDQSFAAGPLKDAFTKIDTAYGTAPVLKAQKKRIRGGKVSAPSLMELLNSLSSASGEQAARTRLSWRCYAALLRCLRESWPTIEIELSPGTYGLSLDFKSWVGYRIPVLEEYNGWNLDSLRFELNGLYVEWV